MEETTLSGQHGTTFHAGPTKLRSPFGWKAALLLGLAAVCTVVFVFVFLSRATTPLPTTPTEQAARRASSQEPNRWDAIVQEMIAEGELTPDHPASPEAQRVTPTGNYADVKNSAAIDAEYAEIADRLFGPAPAAPMTPAERVKHYEDAVTSILN